MAVLLGSAAPGAASQEPAGAAFASAQGERVSERLAAIRDAVSAVAERAGGRDAAGEQRLAWGNWWGNGGWGWRRLAWGGLAVLALATWNNWRNGWHNWRNGWGNW